MIEMFYAFKKEGLTSFNLLYNNKSLKMHLHTTLEKHLSKHYGERRVWR